LYQVKQVAGDWGITAENMEKSQHTDLKSMAKSVYNRVRKKIIDFANWLLSYAAPKPKIVDKAFEAVKNIKMSEKINKGYKKLNK